MSIEADDRFSSVQQFEQALRADLRSQESSTLKLPLILPEFDLSLKPDSVEQKPLEPMIAPTSTSQTNSVKPQSPEPFIEPSVPTVQQAPVPEVPPLLALTEEPPAPEAVPSTLATEEPPAPEVVPSTLATEEPPAPEVAPTASLAQEAPELEAVAPTIADQELSASEVVPLPVVAEEPPVLEVVSTIPTQSPVIPEKAVEIPAESVQRRAALSREPGTLQAASSKQTFEKHASASVPKQPRAWKFGVLHIILALLIGFGISAVLWSDIPFHPSVHSGTPTPGVNSPTPTPPPVSSIYPMLTGMYSGTIYDLSVNVSTSMLLSGIRQSQGNISGYLTLGPKMQGSGPFSGTIDTTKELKFVVTDAKGNATLFFEGVLQSGASLTGDYYRCSPAGLGQQGQCSQAPGSYGIWDIVLLSSGQSLSDSTVEDT
jgi:hypothetical protein